MRGSVVKKGSRYYVKIELDPDPATGRRRQKWHSGYRTKREAERARVDLLSRFDRGEYVEPSQQTVAEYLNDWLCAAEPTIRPSTHESYARNVRNHVVPYIGSLRLTKVDGGALNGLYAELLASGRRRPFGTGRGYPPSVVARAQQLRDDGCSLASTASRLRDEFAEAEHITRDTLASLLRRQAKPGPRSSAGLDPRTVNYVHAIIHRAFKDAVRWGRLMRNPADAADPPHGRPKSDGIEAWAATTLREFLADSSARDDRLHALWVLVATTGMRRGEALGLRWQDVDLDGGRIRVVQTIIQIRSEARLSEPKTSRGRRPIALDRATIAVLRDHRRKMLEERLFVGAGFVDHGLVFHQPDGSCLKPDSVSAAFVRRVEAALACHG